VLFRSLHYYDRAFRASRFSAGCFEKYNALLTSEENGNLFQIAKQVENHLFTHAGMTLGWYRSHRADLLEQGDTLESQLNGLFARDREAFFEISSIRGGCHPFGSPLWADITEHCSEKEHFDNEMIQIIGHTQLRTREPLEFGNVRLLDNRQLYLLNHKGIKPFVRRR
jgi:hypothetical protein